MLKPKLVFAVVSYSICSSLLLVSNKYVLHHTEAPGFLLLCQCLFVSIIIPTLGPCGYGGVKIITSAELSRFILVVLSFVGTLFANAKALQHFNVDAIIGLRLTIPLCLSYLEYMYLERELPSRKSLVSLLGVACSFGIYVVYDFFNQSRWQANVWLGVWYTWTIFECVYVKHAVNVSELSTTDQAFYQNFVSLPILFVGISFTERRILSTFLENTDRMVLGLLIVTCILGLGMSYFSFLLRSMVSATTFSMVGNVCKLFTIAINSIIWELHASRTGTISVVLCIAFSTLYSQAPLRNRSESEKRATVESKNTAY